MLKRYLFRYIKEVLGVTFVLNRHDLQIISLKLNMISFIDLKS